MVKIAYVNKNVIKALTLRTNLCFVYPNVNKDIIRFKPNKKMLVYNVISIVKLVYQIKVVNNVIHDLIEFFLIVHVKLVIFNRKINYV